MKGDGFGATSLKLYETGLSNAIDIATVSNTTFSSIGFWPGISDDGEVVAFYGDFTSGLGAGPGIFVSFPNLTGGRTIRKMTGMKTERRPRPGQSWGNNSVCDPGEPCFGELGQDSSNNPLFLSTFTTDSRIGIMHQSVSMPPSGPSDGLENDIIVLCYIATPAKRANWHMNRFLYELQLLAASN